MFLTILHIYSCFNSPPTVPKPSTQPETVNPVFVTPAPPPAYDSESGSSKESSQLSKPSILCVCLFQNVESMLLRCIICLAFSHGECYNTSDPSVLHICAKCALKTRKPCTNKKILDRFSKSEKSKLDRKNWVFDLKKKHVIWYILNKEFKSIQPGLTPDETFLRLQFQFYESSPTCFFYSLMKEGWIILFRWFKYNKTRLLQLLNLLIVPTSSVVSSHHDVSTTASPLDSATPKSILKNSVKFSSSS